MDYSGYSLSGGDPLLMKFQVNSTLIAGIAVLESTTGNAGVVTSTTGGLANVCGVTQDAATYVTAQQTDGTSAERELGVIIDPGAVWRALMSGGATEGTALALHSVTTATTDGLDITTATAWNSPTFLEGVAWGYDGANVGQRRKPTTVDGSSATLTVAFDNDHQVGDRFLRAPWWPLDSVTTLQTTTLLTQANALIAVGTGAAVNVIDMELNDIGNDGTTASFLLFQFEDHILSQTT